MVHISIDHKSKYNLDNKYFECIITDIFLDGNYLSLQLKGNEKLQAYYYFDMLEEKNDFLKNYKLGDKVYIEGKLSIPSNNTNYNLFNYKNYLYNEGIYYTLNIKKYDKVSQNSNIVYSIKNILLERISVDQDNYPYLMALILGDDRYLNDEIVAVYQNIGISHLFAISGMHIGVLSKILISILKKLHLKEVFIYVIVIFFLLIYLFMTGVSPSILRAVILFILLSMNKLFKLTIKTFNIFLVAVSIIMFIDPHMVFKVGFQFSAIISGVLILFGDLINNRKSYIEKLLFTSFLAFLAGLPICLYNFYEINILGFVYNLFFVPFMTYILFPLTLLTLVLPICGTLLTFFIIVMEKSAELCSLIPSSLIFTKINLVMFVIYYIFIFLTLIFWNKNRIVLIIFISCLLVHYNYNYIFSNNFMLALDVSQGDSILIHSKGKAILIDTGGKFDYSREYWQKREHNNNIATSTIIPLLESFGVRKLEHLVLTHGDYDHMGEAINLVENFKVENVIFNCGEFNELEQNLIKVLDKKKIPYYSCIEELNVDNNKLYFLNNRDYGNENDNSSVIYTKLNNQKFLFMGDAGVKVEEDLIEKYNLKDIDVLKVGHHGSKTSTSKEFIDEINPEYSIISVGKNNRYGHPNKEVLSNLEESKIYRTDQDGRIVFKIKNSKLQIETCSP